MEVLVVDFGGICCRFVDGVLLYKCLCFCDNFLVKIEQLKLKLKLGELSKLHTKCRIIKFDYWEAFEECFRSKRKVV